jgi:hypothetical protein
LGMTLNRAEAVGRFPSGLKALPTPSGPRSCPSAAIAPLARQDRGFAFAAFIFSARRVSCRETVNPPGRRNLHCRIEMSSPKGRIQALYRAPIHYCARFSSTKVTLTGNCLE